MIPRAFIDEVLNRVDIVTVISQSVTLKKAGANLQGLCPFHQEKSPSFSVSETKQFYHCFGCGAHGSAISFLMEYAGLTFIDAIEELAKSVGLTVPQQVNDAVKVVDHQQTIALTQSMEKIMGWYQEQLKKNQRAINYLKGRGLSGEIAKRFCMGYAPDAWQNLDALFGSYENEAIAKLLSESGMMIQGEADGAMKVKRYDRFRDRIMFPIRNLKGQVIGFGGRILDKGEPKYLNSPETSLFKKGQTLYGLFEARKYIREKDYVLVCEGYMDVVALAQTGFPNAVATLGTACTDHHVQLLLRHTDRVVFSFDGDSAGKKAAKRAFEASIPLLADDKEIRFLFLPEEHDPDSFIRTYGQEKFELEIKKAQPLSRFFIDVVGEHIDWSTAEGRAQAQNLAKEYFKKMPPIALRVQILRDLAKRLGLTQVELEKFYGLPSTQEVDIVKKEKVSDPTFKKMGSKEDWKKKTELRALENLAKQRPVAPTTLVIQMMWILIQFPQLGKNLKQEHQVLLENIAQQRSARAKVVMQHLLSLCQDVKEDTNFAVFQNTLMSSDLASDFEALIKKVFESEFSLEEAKKHLDGALKKLDIEAAKKEMLEITEKINEKRDQPEDLARYRELGIKLSGKQTKNI
ncbi:MAG: DNA primase [Betaproteobacteria bacterium]